MKVTSMQITQTLVEVSGIFLIILPFYSDSSQYQLSLEQLYHLIRSTR